MKNKFLYSLFLLTVIVIGNLFINSPVQAAVCGEKYAAGTDTCNCEGGSESVLGDPVQSTTMCCGWVVNNSCVDMNEEALDPFGGVTNETLDTLNPLMIGGGEDINDISPSDQATALSKPGGIINRALQFAFPLAGLILFVMIVMGGFQMIAGATSKKSLEDGQKRVTAAIVGFIILFAAYWLIQLVEQITGVNILNA